MATQKGSLIYIRNKQDITINPEANKCHGNIRLPVELSERLVLRWVVLLGEACVLGWGLKYANFNFKISTRYY